MLAVVLGLNSAFETPSRRALVREVVGREELRNAVTLNSVTVNAARAVGPAIGGPLVGWVIAMSDPRIGLAFGGVSCLLAALGAPAPALALARRPAGRTAPRVPVAELPPASAGSVAPT